MKLIENLETLTEPFDKAVITIGNFDGVHIGHQALFHEVIEKADEIGGTAVAMTFDPHPLRALKQNGHLPLITLREQKIELISASGIDVLIVVPFNLDFASLTARQFVENILVRRIGTRAMVVGKDYRFGRNREGDLEMLRRFSREMGFELIVSDWIQAARQPEERISSTRIRELVLAGNLTEAARMLGRNYQVRGTVAVGRNRGGRLLGFPTANVNLQDELCPPTGVYAVTVDCRGKTYHGVANIGYSPTFDDNVFTVEAHILDFDASIYGEKIRVNFIDRIRDEKKFSGIQELSDQIRLDVLRAREIFKQFPVVVPKSADE